MNWTLIAILSAFGLFMGLQSSAGLTRRWEPLFWVVGAGVCSFFVAEHAPEHFFLTSLYTGIAWGVLNAIVISAMFPWYIKNNPQFQESLQERPSPLNPRILYLITGPVIGAATGLAMAGMAWLVLKLLH